MCVCVCVCVGEGVGLRGEVGVLLHICSMLFVTVINLKRDFSHDLLS